MNWTFWNEKEQVYKSPGLKPVRRNLDYFYGLLSIEIYVEFFPVNGYFQLCLRKKNLQGQTSVFPDFFSLDISWWKICGGQQSPLFVIKKKNGSDERRTHWFLISLCTTLCQHIVLVHPLSFLVHTNTHTHIKYLKDEGNISLGYQQRTLVLLQVVLHFYF